MYFKQIEMSGFKSFADRTAVRLEPGTTAIVGPNGCGKSNILDAMRWVLGEQRARELRGSNMQDIIFNGSEQRHASGMAEVTVTFDNADSKLPVDFAEVAVTRRVYRSGESEYLINKAACRLKDIQELFMDTGIGTQAYSMVGQGKMDLILSSKPEDRRFLFEEAAGIIKYKNRKRLAMRRLESAEQNLLRLNDIVTEVERQMRSLKRQVNAAIRHRELTEQLREIEIRAAWLKHQHLTAAIKDMRAKLAESQDLHGKLSAEISKLEARHEEIGLAKLEIDRVLLVRREGVHQIDTEMEKLESQIALLRQQSEFAAEQQRRAGDEETQFRERAETIEKNLEEAAQRAERLQQEKAACNESLAAKQAEHENASKRVLESDAQLDALRQRLAEQMNTRVRTETQLEKLDATLGNFETQLERIYERQKAVEERREGLLRQSESLRAEEQAKQAALGEAEEKHRQQTEAQQQHTQTLRQVDEEWQGVRESRGSAEARLRSLRELRDAYEGFATGVRAVMRAKAEKKANLSGIIGPVGDLLSSDKTYEQAIEAALGGNINNIFVEDADAAKRAIDFLKQHKAGRVTFLPLDIIRGGRRDDGGKLKKAPGVVGAAIDYVRYEARLEKAVEYLLQNTLIVETLDDAIRIARSEVAFPRLVTLEGEMVNPSGAVTGGAVRHQSRGLLGRSAEIGELEQQVAAADESIKNLVDRRNGLNETIDSLGREIRTLTEQEQTLRRELNEVGMAMARQSAELDNLNEENKSLGSQRDGLCAQRDATEAQRKEALAQVDSMSSDDEVLQQEAADANENASRARQALSVCAGELSDLRVKQAGLTQQAEEVQREHERFKREREELLQEVERRSTMQTDYEDRQKTLAEEIALQIERSKTFSESKEEARKKVVEADNQRQALLDETDGLDKELRRLREQAREAQATLHSVELDLRSNEERVHFFQELILTEYNIALASLKADEVGDDEYDDDARDKLVASLRNQLQRMGEVNLMAIEEYENLEQRHTFLVDQCNDLAEARQTLLDVIERSDTKIREMFMDTFNRVSDYFRDFYRQLFNGGQARIYLVDEDDPLESGIEIEARPPGKKPTSISLLSGGESAMTAIALLFSIFKAKPSPFCVLDEVDAPLDDANIGRFLRMLEEFKSSSQFIIITHNKATMAHADALYGVTMQERGVSQLVSVKFKDVEEPAA